MKMDRWANSPKKRVGEAHMSRAQLCPPQHWAYARLDPAPQGRSSNVPTLSSMTNLVPSWLPLEKPTGNDQRHKAQRLSAACRICGPRLQPLCRGYQQPAGSAAHSCSPCVEKQRRVSASSLFWPKLIKIFLTQNEPSAYYTDSFHWPPSWRMYNILY